MVSNFLFQRSLHYFGYRRTDRAKGSRFQGVETPSQVSSKYLHDIQYVQLRSLFDSQVHSFYKNNFIRTRAKAESEAFS